MENTTQLFLATRFNCNKCHDHPFEHWNQDQYYQTAAFFAQVGFAIADSCERRNEPSAARPWRARCRFMRSSSDKGDGRSHASAHQKNARSRRSLSREV